jgi:putative transposase
VITSIEKISYRLNLQRKIRFGQPTLLIFLDIWLRKKRDTQAAYAFLKRLHKQFGEPKAIVTDKAPSLGSAFRKLQSVGLYTKTEHRTVKYLNNLIEQDHRPIKRRNKFYQSLRTASSTIKGMETIRGIYKKNRRNGTLFGFSVSTEIGSGAKFKTNAH